MLELYQKVKHQRDSCQNPLWSVRIPHVVSQNPLSSQLESPVWLVRILLESPGFASAPTRFIYY